MSRMRWISSRVPHFWPGCQKWGFSKRRSRFLPFRHDRPAVGAPFLAMLPEVGIFQASKQILTLRHDRHTAGAPFLAGVARSGDFPNIEEDSYPSGTTGQPWVPHFWPVLPEVGVFQNVEE